jgi:hypothetical protein
MTSLTTQQQQLVSARNSIASNKKNRTSTSSSTLVEIANSAKTAASGDKKDQHQPYSTSLVNSGFGFGFDLQGGDADNQLTFIVNVHPNGDAARKGLTDG